MLFLAILKKNLLLFITLAVSLVISVALLFLVLQKTGKIKEYQRTLKENTARIDEAAKLPPPGPVRENLENIKKDTLIVQKKGDEIHYIFGKPYRVALQAFCEKLGEDEFALCKKWRDAYLKESKMGNQPEQIFINFMKKYDQEKADAAKAAFKEALDKTTVEPIANTNEIIFEAMGLQRKMSPEECRTYMANMNKRLLELLSSDVGKGISITVPDKNVFSVYENKMPVADHIPYITKNYKMIEDLVYRMKKAGITNIKSLSKSGTIEGYTDKGYLFLPYKMTITSSLDAMRDFINILKDAYKDNRIYKIKFVSLEKVKDDAAAIAVPAEKVKEEVDENNPFKPKKDGDTAQVAPTEFILGESSEVLAEITFEYVTYVENEMIRKSK